MEMMYWLNVNWPWVVLAVAIIIIGLSIKSKIVRAKMNSLFGWPPSP